MLRPACEERSHLSLPAGDLLNRLRSSLRGGESRRIGIGDLGRSRLSSSLRGMYLLGDGERRRIGDLCRGKGDKRRSGSGDLSL